MTFPPLAADSSADQPATSPTSAGPLAAVFAALPSASLLLTPALRIAAVSDAYLALSRTTRQQLLGQDVFEAFSGQPATPEGTTMANLRASLRQVLATGQPHAMPVQHYNLPDPAHPGAALANYWEPLNTPVLDAQGTVTGLLHTVVNVTEQVLARQQVQTHNAELEAHVAARTQEAELARDEAKRQHWRLEQFIMQSPNAICIFNGPEWVYELVNSSFQQLLPGRQLLGRQLVEALPEMVGQPLLAVLQAVYDTGVPFESKEVAVPLARTPGGPMEDRYFDLTYQARFDIDGKIDGCITYAQDVTAQVLARRLQAAQQQQLLGLFEQAPVGLAIFRGPQYTIELVNPAVCAMWGRTPAQALRTPLFELLPEAAGQGFEQLLDEVMATGVPYVAHELPSFIDRQGRRDTVYWNFVYQPLHEGPSPVTAVMVVATDVTEQVLARQQVQTLNSTLLATNTDLRAANQQLTRTNEDLDNFIYTASHDLWAPISNIEGLLTALRQDLAQPADAVEIPELLDLMQEAVGRFKRTIRDLTDVARLQKAHAQPAAPVGLAQLIQDVCLDLAPQLTASGTGLTVDVDACPNLYFVEKNLRSIVYNLLSNAIKYRHPDRTPRILVRCYIAGAFAVLAVRDNGLGLDTRQSDKIFGLFQRLHDHVEGSGIGLYMVKKIIESAGGSIEVESQPGECSTFLVYFPL